jgi:hypothetical protein
MPNRGKIHHGIMKINFKPPARGAFLLLPFNTIQYNTFKILHCIVLRKNGARHSLRTIQYNKDLI